MLDQKSYSPPPELTASQAIGKMLVSLAVATLLVATTLYCLVRYVISDVEGVGQITYLVSAGIFGLISLLAMLAFYETRTPDVRTPVGALAAGVRLLSRRTQIIIAVMVFLLTSAVIYGLYWIGSFFSTYVITRLILTS